MRSPGAETITVALLLLAPLFSICAAGFDSTSRNCSYFPVLLQKTEYTFFQLSNFATLPPVNPNCTSKSEIPTYVGNVDVAVRTFEEYRSHVTATAAAVLLPAMMIKHYIQELYHLMPLRDMNKVRSKHSRSIHGTICLTRVHPGNVGSRNMPKYNFIIQEDGNLVVGSRSGPTLRCPSRCIS
jgi:hypothetical protein